MNQELQFIENLALRAGSLLLESFTQIPGIKQKKTRLKSDRSIVTDADIQVDNFLRAEITNSYPDDLIISEESSSSTPENLDINQRNIWIIDPLDGTTNFSLGWHYWGVLISKLVNGFPEISVQYFPLIDEFYSASYGKGAYLNGSRLKITGMAEANPSTFFTCCSRTHKEFDVRVPYKTRIPGSAGYAFACIAKESSLIGFEASPKIWDISAGWLLVKEAGGIVITINQDDPFPIKPGIDYENIDIPIIISADEKTALKASKWIIPK